MSAVAGVFPAHAGMSPPPTPDFSEIEGFPRTRGDEPLIHSTQKQLLEFSPHTRG